MPTELRLLGSNRHRPRYSYKRGIGAGSGPLPGLRLWHFHDFGAPKQPVDADIQPVGNLCKPVNVQRLKPCKMEIDRRSAKAIMVHLPDAASLLEMIVQN